MPEVATRADSLRLYLTGAGSDGGAQADPEASLGGYRSSTADGGMGFLARGDALPTIRIDFASYANGVGLGTLATTDTDEVTWTPPGGTAGAGVTITSGQSRLVEGSDTAVYLRITRMDATALRGSLPVRLVDPFNNVIGMDNLSSAEAAAGRTEYRAYMIRNDSAYTVENLRLWLVTPTSGFAYAFEATVSNAIQTIANETTAPTGLTWQTNTTSGSGTAYGSVIPNGGMVGLWIRRTTSAGATFSASVLQHLGITFSANSF